MDRVGQRLEIAHRALATLQELAGLGSPSKIERDAAIQRFEYSVEAVWKAARGVLASQFGLELASPKPVVRASAQNGLLSEVDGFAAMVMIDDRNLTSHTYDETLANAIFGRLAAHSALMERWLAAMTARED